VIPVLPIFLSVSEFYDVYIGAFGAHTFFTIKSLRQKTYKKANASITNNVTLHQIASHYIFIAQKGEKLAIIQFTISIYLFHAKFNCSLSK
jgi:hypothetical protein